MMSCDRCGKCCQRMGLPPFIMPNVGGTERPHGAAAASYAVAVKYAMTPGNDIEKDFGGCWWYDKREKRCRFYSQRPEICREYDCSELREPEPTP